MTPAVVVVGAGLAGVCAAIAAAEAGADVTVLEKTPAAGGSTVLSGGFFAFADTTEQRAAGIDDSAAALARDLLDVGEHRNDPTLVEAYACGQADLLAWLRSLGLELLDVELSAGQSVPRSHRSDPPALIRRLVDHAHTLGVTFRYETAARSLLVDGDRVVGVSTAHGPVPGAVVLTCGGFSRSEELLSRYAPTQARALRVGGDGNVGDGLRLAFEVGAAARDFEFVKGTFGAHPSTTNDREALLLLFYLGAIIVNADGERYVDESISYKLLGDACLAQPDPVSFQVFDHGIVESAPEGVALFDPRPHIDAGLVHQAETLTGLAAMTGASETALAQTVATYNDGVVSGTDAYGRTGLVHGAGARVRLDRPPFYGFPSTSVVLATYCGLLVDSTAAVLRADGSPIAGLWAAGELTGGFHGAAYMTGSSLGKAAFFGRAAGHEAAACT